jgi:plasmid stabilization system protein ParE
MQLQFFTEAMQDVEESRAWYRQRSESAEAAYLRELDHSIEQVADFPLRWPEHVHATRRYVFPRFPYSIVYFVADAVVYVVTVCHDSRRPGHWRARLEGRR